MPLTVIELPGDVIVAHRNNKKGALSLKAPFTVLYKEWIKSFLHFLQMDLLGRLQSQK